MAEDTTTTTTDTTADAAADAVGTADAGGRTYSQAELERILGERLARERAKYSDYPELKRRAAAAMTEQEKAVAEAETRGATTATAKTGARLARAEFKAAAAGRVDDSALAGFLEYADVTKFVGDDGEPDSKAIEAAIKKLGGTERGTNFDGGARTSAPAPTDMSALIRRAAGRG